MFQYEKTNNKKWPWRVTAAGWILLPELRGLGFSFDPAQTVWFFFWTPGGGPGAIQRVTICRGYAWDGCSGPVPTTRRSARASCVHDVLYQSMREGLLGQEYRSVADKSFTGCWSRMKCRGRSRGGTLWRCGSSAGRTRNGKKFNHETHETHKSN